MLNYNVAELRLTMLKSCEAFFIYTHLNMANLIPFTKRFESSENLVNLLESRGLQIYDRNKAIQYLDNIGYYRLSAYMYPLLKMPKTAHLYKEDSSFKKVMMLYRFDKKLRLLMFNEIEKIEIAIRRAVMQITADMTGNPFWLHHRTHYHRHHQGILLYRLLQSVLIVVLVLCK